MLKHLSLILLLLLAGCSSETQAEKSKLAIESKSAKLNNINITDIIATNNSSCLLSEKGEVYCWDAKKQGAVKLQDMSRVELAAGAKALKIYGNSGDVHYFDTGYHACALMDNNSVRCWGEITSDTVFDAKSIFDMTLVKSTDGSIKSYAIKKNLLNKMGRIKSLITNHGVVCTINNKNTLYCPHKHLAFLDGREGVKHAVFGEILSCIQNLDDEVECYDMRGGVNAGPIFMSLDGDSWPKLFDFRYVYAAGVTFITKDGAALYWQGPLPEWEKFPGMYGIETTPLTLGKNIKATAIHMSEVTACLQLNDGSVTCWGRSIGGDKSGQDIIGAPGAKLKFGNNRKVRDLALGSMHSCFLLDDNTIDCFVRGQ